MTQVPNLPQELRSAQVIIRFCLRMTILVAFATFSGVDFARSLSALLWMSTVFSAVVGAVKREPPFYAILNHWDETAAYAALFCLVHGFNQAAP